MSGYWWDGPIKPAKRPSKGQMPTAKQILAFIENADEPAGKREIARHFHLRGAEKIALKALLKDMADEGLIDSAPGRAYHKMGGIPRVTVLRIVDVEEGPVAVPDNWQADIPAPRLRIVERGKRTALTKGDRILARTEERGGGWIAHPMKKLHAGAELALGVLEEDHNGKLILVQTDKTKRYELPVSDPANAKVGQLVEAETKGPRGRQRAYVRNIIGNPMQPGSFSTIAIHKFDIPSLFDDAVLKEAEAVSNWPLDESKREDLRALPFIAIDPEDARDHDDAVWAQQDDDAENRGGYLLKVAIADVSHYVRPGSALDKSARQRGNSVYFPDQVVPMLPERLSADICSLKEGADRASMVCHMRIDDQGNLFDWRFSKALVRLAHNIAYEDAQAQYDERQTHLAKHVLTPLWACWSLLKKARDKRQPLDLDLPERRVRLDEEGRIAEIATRARLDAHRLVEDMMICANVAAAKALETKKQAVAYRVHETPAREKLLALKDYLATLDISFALGQVIQPKTFNGLMNKVQDNDLKQLVTTQVLRSQTQAYYGPTNLGHFGLSLGHYAHFTSPIRRYADILVHRALIDGFHLTDDIPANAQKEFGGAGLHDKDKMNLRPICEAISGHERRAMQAERETVDRYIAAHLSSRIGDIFDVRITGVQKFGFFVTTVEVGGDGLVPAGALGREYYYYDEAAQTLTGEVSDKKYSIGQRLRMRLTEANAISGAMTFAPVKDEEEDFFAGDGGSGTSKLGIALDKDRARRKVRSDERSGSKSARGHAGKYRRGKKGRPANIRK